VRNRVLNILIEGGLVALPFKGSTIAVVQSADSKPKESFDVDTRTLREMVDDGLICFEKETGLFKLRSEVRREYEMEKMDRERIIHTLQAGWTIFTGPGWPVAIIRIDDRYDERIPISWLRQLEQEGVIESTLDRVSAHSEDHMTVFRMVEDPTARLVLKFANKQAMDAFLHGLSFSWGQNHVRVQGNNVMMRGSVHY
jgi:hypothetical protein